MSKKTSLPRKFSKILAISFVIWICVHSIAIIIDGIGGWSEKADVAVILGNKVNPTGRPALRLKLRLDKGIDVYRRGQVQKLVVSGGVGREGFDEAVVMKNYLVAHKIPRTAILADSHGNNTYLTAKNTRKLALKYGWHSIIVISQYYHLSRVKLAFRRFGMTNVYSIHADIKKNNHDLFSIFREFVAYYFYYFRSYS